MGALFNLEDADRGRANFETGAVDGAAVVQPRLSRNGWIRARGIILDCLGKLTTQQERARPTEKPIENQQKGNGF